MMGGSPSRTERASAASTLALPAEWTVTASGEASSLAVAADGTVYFADASGLHAIREDGTSAWTFLAPGSYRSSPAIGRDGTVYFGSGMDLVAVNPDGTSRWKFSVTDGVIDTSAAVGDDGTIYFAAADDHLHALGPEGSERWSAPVGNGGEPSSPAIGPSGVLYVVAYEDSVPNPGTRLFAVRGDGTNAWSVIVFASTPPGAPTAGDDGTIYVPGDGFIYAFQPDGTHKWEAPIATGSQGLALGKDGTLYAVGSSFGPNVHAVHGDGSAAWTALTQEETGGVPPVIGPDGTVFVIDHEIHAFRPDGVPLGMRELGAMATTPAALGENGMIYVVTPSASHGGLDSEVHAVRLP